MKGGRGCSGIDADVRPAPILIATSCRQLRPATPPLPLVQGELQGELAAELAGYGLDPGAEGLSETQLSQAMRELERRRAGGWAAVGGQGSRPGAHNRACLLLSHLTFGLTLATPRRLPCRGTRGHVCR